MKPNKEDLTRNYDPKKHFGIECFMDNPKLDKLLTGEGAKLAKEKFKDYIEFDADFNKEDKYRVWQIASKINENPDVSFFTCVADRTVQHLHIELWGSDTLITSSGLVGENGNVMLEILMNK